MLWAILTAMKLPLFLLTSATLASSLGAEQAWISLSKVGGINAYKGRVALFGVKASLAELPIEFRGPGANAFSVSNIEKEESSLLLLEIDFRPAAERAFYSAEIVVGAEAETQVVQLRGISTKALEGKNEPPLQEIFQALGAEVDAGGVTLHLDTGKKKIGDSVAAGQFEPVEGQALRITPLARYSPRGETEFGLVSGTGEAAQWRTLGALAATTSERPDAHQTLRPPLSGGLTAIEFADAPEKFALFFKAHQYTSLTIPGKSVGAPIKHTARIYPVSQFEGRKVAHAYLVGFEEASNGDYQDAVFLIEGVKAVK